MNDLLARLHEWRVLHAALVSAAGALALALYDVSQENYSGAGKALVTALGLAGLWARAMTTAPDQPSV